MYIDFTQEVIHSSVVRLYRRSRYNKRKKKNKKRWTIIVWISHRINIITSSMYFRWRVIVWTPHGTKIYVRVLLTTKLCGVLYNRVFTTICGHRGQNPGGVGQPGSDTNISTVSHNFQQCCVSHFDAVGCQNYYCQFKYMYIL